MSIRSRPNGRWEVRWLEAGRHRSRSFARKGDAQRFELEVTRRRQLGGLVPLVEDLTLGEWVEQWWRDFAVPNLAPRTRASYALSWSKHVRPSLGGYRLREISPAVVEALIADLRRGGVGEPTIIRALTVLQSAMGRAVVHGRMERNPVREVRKPRQPAPRRRDPLDPATVERIRAELGSYDATLVAVLAYAGMRPDEATRLDWSDVGQRAVRVDSRKTGQVRHVRLLGPLAQDLAEWRLASGRPERGLIFPRTGGKEWTDTDWRNWRRRVYQPAAVAAGVTGDMRPYRLRGSFASLLLWEGRSVVYVADQCGHSVATLSRHYAAVLEELEPGRTTDAEGAIREARDAILGYAQIAHGAE